MTEKKYRVHDWVKFDYSEIGEYIDENHTDKPLRNDEIVDLLNELHEENQDLKSFNKDLAESLSACANARISKDNLIEKLTKENEQLKEIIYDDESQIIGEWSSHIQEDIEKLDKAYESDDINDLIRFCKRC